MAFTTTFEKVYAVTQYVRLCAAISKEKYPPQFRLRINKRILVPLKGIHITLSKVVDWQIPNKPNQKSTIIMGIVSIQNAWNIKILVQCIMDITHVIQQLFHVHFFILNAHSI